MREPRHTEADALAVGQPVEPVGRSLLDITDSINHDIEAAAKRVPSPGSPAAAVMSRSTL